MPARIFVRRNCSWPKLEFNIIGLCLQLKLNAQDFCPLAASPWKQIDAITHYDIEWITIWKLATTISQLQFLFNQRVRDLSLSLTSMFRAPGSVLSRGQRPKRLFDRQPQSLTFWQKRETKLQSYKTFFSSSLMLWPCRQELLLLASIFRLV